MNLDDIEILLTDNLGHSLGMDDGGKFYIRRSSNDYWEPILAKNIVEAEEYFGEYISC